MPLAQAAHSGETRSALPKTEAPGALAPWATAWARATATGRRSREATATEALSITRLTAIAALSASGTPVAVATSASFQASCSSRASRSALGWTRTWCSITGLLVVSGGPDGYGRDQRLPRRHPPDHRANLRNPYNGRLRIGGRREECGC